ncbi:flagellar biosynthetic protein FliR [Rubrivivax gelatinosus]|uniref:Flagellar biosynthetic protein FliR n=1 Tax=Rubrivivax gelatinosus TaxID=28068 RepID=A0ABS1DZ54_RUBGE|nr:flagellar biosynthetic protein FliR [Rubrivivax gelatinosus]MBK1616108.1 flagellar biosynthetic protein FliR [Rubrivivax gelatinosus]MBK1715344.1 flagellar biosynthetic protein FliR [Rubrivivax gelatinosus]
MEALYGQWLALVGQLWWPFCRVLAFFAATTILGDAMVPVTLRVLLSLVLAVVLLPIAQPPQAIDPFSLAGVAATVEQALIGLVLGLAFQLVTAVLGTLGFLASSQIGLSMAVMNDPMNGESSDVVSSLLHVLGILVFFAVDGHLVVAGVAGASFKAWPVGGGLAGLSLQALPLAVAWVFSAALLLALPLVLSALVVQIGLGLLNRVSPALNLYSLGFAVVTGFGLLMLVALVRHLPEHYLNMLQRVLDLIEHGLRTAHG